MDVLVIVAACLFAIMMCLGLILVKWITSQIGITLFAMILFLAVAIIVLAMGDEKNDCE